MKPAPTQRLVYCFDSPDPDATRALAALLGRAIGARGLALGLIGGLGSGKTVFVKGLAEGLGIDPRLVSSPTFVIAQQYAIPEGPELLHHLDFYRLAAEAELEAIGFFDLLAPGQVVAVEWLDRFPDALGSNRLEVVFARPDACTSEIPLAGDTLGRRLVLTAFGDEAARVLRDLAARHERLEAERSGGAGEREAGAGSSTGLGRLVRWAAPEVEALALLLVALGLGGFGLALSTADRPREAWACAALGSPARASIGALLAPPGSGTADELGPLEVVCAEDAGSERGSSSGGSLDGVARLLAGRPIDPNRASARVLELLPGIGPARAAAIVEAREQAPFRTVADVERAHGIGPGLRAGLEPFLAVDPEEPAG